MTIAIKYCGGCNPRYDRIAAAARLGELLPEARILGADADDPHAVVVVCGCASRCADLGGLEGRLGTFFVASPEDMERLPALLRNTNPHLKNYMHGD